MKNAIIYFDYLFCYPFLHLSRVEHKHDKEGSIDRLKAAGPEVCMRSKIEIKTH